VEALLATEVIHTSFHFKDLVFYMRNSSKQTINVLPAKDSLPTGIDRIVSSCIVEPFAALLPAFDIGFEFAFFRIS
jgi:hypothetical protein